MEGYEGEMKAIPIEALSLQQKFNDIYDSGKESLNEGFIQFLVYRMRELKKKQVPPDLTDVLRMSNRGGMSK